MKQAENGKNIYETLAKKYNQVHIGSWIEQLSPKERDVFGDSIQGLDFDLVFDLFDKFSKEGKKSLPSLDLYKGNLIEYPKDSDQRKYREKAISLGEELLRNGQVAVLIVAGGQASRLGWDKPKGTFPISPVKQKSLFQIFSEKIKSVAERYETKITTLILVNEENSEQVKAYFSDHSYFGLDSKYVQFIEQNMLPALTPDGQLIRKDKNHLMVSPDGHGGTLLALKNASALDILVSQGVTDIFYCQIDNPLINIADPAFLGYHHMNDAEISTKVIRRTDCEEKVGIFMCIDGKDGVVEYSDIDPDHRCLRDEQNNILNWAGNTGIHLFSLSLLKHLADANVDLPYHRAIKEVNSFTPDGQLNKMTAWKFEKFIFDLLPYAQKTCCVEVLRKEEFEPLKNKEGNNSPQTVRQALIDLYADWLKEAQIDIPKDAVIEISPSFAIDKQEFLKKIKGRRVAFHDNKCFLD